MSTLFLLKPFSTAKEMAELIAQTSLFTSSFVVAAGVGAAGVGKETNSAKKLKAFFEIAI
jgi:hypothetical protein